MNKPPIRITQTFSVRCDTWHINRIEWKQKRQPLTDLFHTNPHITAWSQCRVLGKLLDFWTSFKGTSVQSERIPATDENYQQHQSKPSETDPTCFHGDLKIIFINQQSERKTTESKHHHQVCYFKQLSCFQLHLITVQFSWRGIVRSENGHHSFMCSPGHQTIIQLTDCIRVLMF